MSEEDETQKVESPEKKPLALNQKAAKRKKVKKTFLAVGGVAVVAGMLSVGGYYGYNSYVESQKVDVPRASETSDAKSRNDSSCAVFVSKDLQCSISWKANDDVDRGHLVSQSVASGSRVKAESKVILTYSIGPAEIEFPNLVGQDVDDSKDELADYGITVSDIKEVNGDDIPEGKIVSTSIEPGTKVKNGSKVEFEISKGTIKVPDWADQTREYVEADANKNNINVDFIEKESDKPSGIVLEQSVKSGGYVAAGDTVEITVSKQKDADEGIEVPDVIGSSLAEAQSELAFAGFTNFKTEFVESDDTEEEIVSDVSPDAGEKASADTELTITVSKPTSE